jgi:hypothetical protein
MCISIRIFETSITIWRQEYPQKDNISGVSLKYKVYVYDA